MHRITKSGYENSPLLPYNAHDALRQPAGEHEYVFFGMSSYNIVTNVIILLQKGKNKYIT